jgi:acyl transferase domain-containing protein
MTSMDVIDPTTRIAIVGLAGRFPGADSIAEFWQNLRDGVESIAFFSEQELIDAGVDPALVQQPNYVKAAGILNDIEYFDAGFFGLTPREAEAIDPQQRLFLECASAALEDAGYDSERYAGRIGLYAGASMNTYLLHNVYANPAALQSIGGFQVQISNDKDHVTTRAAYKLNLRGPAVTIQTTCSTSLVAVHMACQSLLNNECDMALAGGVSVRVPQKVGYLYQEGGITSPDGHCRAFDANAQGTNKGNGLGLVVLKRLPDALNDGDHIYAVIAGSAINNDGALKMGYTAPSVDGQAEAIAEALGIADVDPATIGFVEAHGTGTALNDPIEIAALSQAFRESTDNTQFCAIGSVKTNIGHLDAAAGVAGLIKATLAIKHGQIPPTLHFERPHPGIDFASSPFFVNNRLLDWQPGDRPRRAGVSSLGIGGTNAHVILEEAPAPEPGDDSRAWHLLPLSARTATALERQRANLAEALRARPELDLADVTYTLQVGRRAFSQRQVAICSSREDAIAVLEGADPRRLLSGSPERGTPAIVFMFPGQGAQFVNMGRELYEREAIFREQVDRCCELLRPHVAPDLRELLYPAAEQSDANEQLTQTAYAQPALFVIEYALAQLWMSWGVKPQALVGHSIGEYVAATLAGVFSLADALRLVATRGRLIQSLPSGSMLAVALGEEALLPLLSTEPQLAIAAINGPQSSVLSGPSDGIAAIQRQLEAQGIECRRLHTSHAFHSAMMEPILAPFADALSRVALHPPQIPYISNLTGTWISAQQATDPQYWLRHLRAAVRFADGLVALRERQMSLLLELGPGRTLSSLAKLQASAWTTITTMRHPQDLQGDETALLTAVGRAWLAGVEVDWDALHAGSRRRRVSLPTYPFERQRFWIEPQSQPAAIDRPLSRAADLSDWCYTPIWKQAIRPPLDAAIVRGEQALTWLVFVDRCGIGEQLARRLQSYRQSVITVTPGAGFAVLGANAYRIDPAQRDNYAELIASLGRQGQRPQRILHCWSVAESGDATGWEEAQSRGFYSLLWLAQALGDQADSTPLHISVVSSAMQSVLGDELLRPEQATLLGGCTVIPKEYPSISCQSIDLPALATSRPRQQFIDWLLADCAAPSQDLAIAYRGQGRWVRTFEPLPLDKADRDRLRLRHGGVYLIVGGLGGIGLTLATFLAQNYQARLILTGRTALPDRSTWPELLQSQPDSPLSDRLRRIQALEAAGSELLLAAVDVTDDRQMQALVAQSRERFGTIHGVIHAAGISAGGLIQFKDAATAHAMLAPKVQGVLVLDQLFKTATLDFLLLCSAINSITGAFGLADYCAANAFLDAYAHDYRARRDALAVAVNWDVWQDVGMAVATDLPPELRRQRESQLSQGIRVHEGMQLFERIIAAELPQVIVSTRDFQAVLAQSRRANETSQVAPEIAPGGLEAHPRPAIATAYQAPRDEIEQQIVTIWQAILGIQQVGVHDDFFELNGHSLLATQLISRLRAAFQVDLPLRTIFERPTVAELATAIAQQRAAQVDDDLLGQMLADLEGLTDEEVAMLLADDEQAIEAEVSDE